MTNLKNIHILNTRPASEEDILTELLVKKGAEVSLLPTTYIVENELDERADTVFNQFTNFTHLVFTSKNGVKYFFKKLNDKALSLPQRVKIACIGKHTSSELLKYGNYELFTAAGKNAVEFFSELKNQIRPTDHILLVLGTLAPDFLETSFAEIAKVQRIDVYKTENVISLDKNIHKLLIDKNFELLIFTSPSGFNSFFNLVEKELFLNFKMASIGTSTTAAIRAKGLEPLIESPKPDAETFSNSIENYFITHNIKT